MTGKRDGTAIQEVRHSRIPCHQAVGGQPAFLVAGIVGQRRRHDRHRGHQQSIERPGDDPRALDQVATAIALAEIARYPLILPRAPNPTRSALEAATHNIGTKLTISTEIDTLHGVLQLVENRMGYGVMPVGAVRSTGGAERFRMTLIHSPAVRHQQFLAMPRHGKHTHLAAEVARLIRSQDLQKILG